ncbi:MAG: AbrB/MazE/SpoVT family DNA-binding domain-containing protein, partial [Candidatus Methylomirabilis sp.]
MPLVKIKEKYQVTLPASVRRKAGLAVGDLLEATVEGKKITLTPKSVVDRELALALEDVKKGRVHGPFSSAKDLIRSLH